MRRNYKEMLFYLSLGVVFVIFGCTDAKTEKYQELETRLAEQGQKLAALEISLEEKDEIIRELYCNQSCNDINRTRKNFESLIGLAKGIGDCGGYCGIGIGNPSSYGSVNWISIEEEWPSGV